MKNIILDYDGVLVDSFCFHLKRQSEVFEIDINAEELKDAHNGNFHQTKLSKLSGTDPHFYAETVKNEQKSLSLFNGAIEAVKRLAQNHQLFIVSGGFKLQIEPNLKNSGIDHLFTKVLGAEDSLSKHENFLKLFEEGIEENESIFVTDTLGDLLAVQNFNLSTIAVTFGFHDRDRLQKGNPDYFADTWEEIEEIIDSAKR